MVSMVAVVVLLVAAVRGWFTALLCMVLLYTISKRHASLNQLINNKKGDCICGYLQRNCPFIVDVLAVMFCVMGLALVQVMH